MFLSLVFEHQVITFGQFSKLLNWQFMLIGTIVGNKLDIAFVLFQIELDADFDEV